MTVTVFETPEVVEGSPIANRESERLHGFLFRTIEPRDFDQYVTLRHMACKEFPSLFELFPDEDLAIPNETKRAAFSAMAGIGVFNEEDWVGMIFLSFFPMRKLRHRATIHSLYVKPEYRGASLAKQLITRVISLAQDLGCQQVECAISDENDITLAFGEKFGFQEVGRVPNAILVDGQKLASVFLARDISGQSDS